MIKIKIADLTIGIDNKYSYTKEICADYLTDEQQTDFQVSAAREEISAEDDGSGFTEGYLESLCLLYTSCDPTSFMLDGSHYFDLYKVYNVNNKPKLLPTERNGAGDRYPNVIIQIIWEFPSPSPVPPARPCLLYTSRCV